MGTPTNGQAHCRLPIASITVNGSYKSLATSANDAGIWTPTTNGTPAYDYYQAVESWRQNVLRFIRWRNWIPFDC